jgi:acid phosphatase family membrane protein YuiD
MNRVLHASLIAWITAQVLKVIFYFWMSGRINFRRLVEAGGMPSSHSALVMALVYGVGHTTGVDSCMFAVACVFALITMYDAAGVRRAAGRQATVLNKIVNEVFREGKFKEERLRELIGHTPVEVLAGAAIGVGISYWLLR